MPWPRGGRFILHTSGFLLFPNIMKEPETLSLQEKNKQKQKNKKLGCSQICLHHPKHGYHRPLPHPYRFFSMAAGAGPRGMCTLSSSM